MLEYQEALKLVLNRTRALPSQKIKLEESFKRVLSSNIYSPLDLPPFNRATMDGFALSSRDFNHLPKDFKIIDTTHAGIQSQKIIRANQAIKIMTGCILPKEADRIIKIEDTQQIKKNIVRILRYSLEKNIAFKGQDCKKGSLLLHKDKIIRPQDLSILASAGINNLKVFIKPRVSILATGNEIIESNVKLKPGLLINSTSLMLKALLDDLDIESKYLGIAKDNKKILKDKISQGLDADILIITGGVSMGEHDYVPCVLDELNVKKLFHKVKIKPGKPIWFGKKNNTLVFGLPGNSVSTLAGFILFIKPALLKMQGQDAKLNIIEGLLDCDLKINQDRLSFSPSKVIFRNGQFNLSPIKFNTSADMKSVSESNSFLISKPGKYIFKKNSKVNFIWL